LYAYSPTRISEDTPLWYIIQQGETESENAANENSCADYKKEKLPWQQELLDTMHYDVDACPTCRQGRMHTFRFSMPTHRPYSYHSI